MPNEWFDWFQNGALAAMVLAFIFGLIVPKPTHDRVLKDNDRLLDRVDALQNTVNQSVMTVGEAMQVLRTNEREREIERDGNATPPGRSRR